MKYSPVKSIQKAIPPMLPVIVAEIIGLFDPKDKEAITAIGAAVCGVWVAVSNWFKNGNKVA